MAGGLVDGHGEHTLLVALLLDGGVSSLPVEVGIRASVVVVFGKRVLAQCGIDVVAAQRVVYLSRCVGGFVCGYDGTQAYQHGQFPQGCGEVVDDASALINLSCEVVHPLTLGQIDAVAHIVAVFLRARFLIYRCHQNAGTEQELVIGTLAACVVVLLVQHHSTHHGLAIHSLAGYAVGIRQQPALELQVVAVDACGRFAQRLRVLGVAAPAVHVELHGCECLPLEIAHVDRHVLSAEDTVHIAGDIGLARQSAADIGGDVETYVLPLAAGLVTCPDGGVALCASPTVQTDDEGTCLGTVVRHHLSHVSHTVEAETVAGSNPCYVSLQHSHAGIAYLSHDVSLQQSLHSLLGMQVALSPQSYLHTALAGVVAKLFQVLYIALQSLCLSVSGSVAIVGQEPSQGEVIVQIAVNGCAGTELVVVLLAVEALLDAAVVLLALVVLLAVLIGHESVLACFGLLPVVAVVGVQMAFVETELGQQHGVAGQLVEVVEQGHSAVIHHHEEVQILRLMAQSGFSGFRLAEVVGAGCKRVPHDAIAACAPVEWCGAGNASIHPVVGVADVDGLSLVAEASVLHAASIEPVVRTLLECERHVAASEVGGSSLLHHLLSVALHAYFALLAQGNLQVAHADGVTLHLEAFHLAAGIIHQYLCWRVGFGVADDSSLWVLEQTEDVRSVEIDVERLPVVECSLHGGCVHPCELLCSCRHGDGQKQYRC